LRALRTSYRRIFGAVSNATQPPSTTVERSPPKELCTPRSPTRKLHDSPLSLLHDPSPPVKTAIENFQDSCPAGLRIAISMVTPLLLGGGHLSRSSSFGRAALSSGSRRPSRSCRRTRRSRPVPPTFKRGFATKPWLRTGCGSGPISRARPAQRFNATFSLAGQTVPEPASLTTLALGAAGVFAAARARRRGRAILH
jgi:hypothetical protein